MKLSDLTDIQLLAGTVRKEAEGEPVLGKMAVACVIRNRVADGRWPDSWQGVVLQAQQFSCFNGLDRGSDLSPAWVRVFTEHRAETWWRECQYAAFGAYWGWYGDVTGGANHYCRHDCRPAWREGREPTLSIGAHVFFRL